MSSSVSLNWRDPAATEGPGFSGMGGALEEEVKGCGVSPRWVAGIGVLVDRRGGSGRSSEVLGGARVAGSSSVLVSKMVSTSSSSDSSDSLVIFSVDLKKVSSRGSQVGGSKVMSLWYQVWRSKW